VGLLLRQTTLLLAESSEPHVVVNLESLHSLMKPSAPSSLQLILFVLFIISRVQDIHPRRSLSSDERLAAWLWKCTCVCTD